MYVGMSSTGPIHLKSIASAAASAVMLIGLAACGGGGDDDAPAQSNTSSTADASKPAAATENSIRVEGQSQSLASDITEVKVLTPPVSWEPNGAFPRTSVVVSNAAVPASLLKELAPGAYTELPRGTGGDPLKLQSGVVTDLSGNGQFAIGRWTAGSDSAGHSYNANQGQHWAVGAPVNVVLGETQTLTCKLAAATRPTSGDGNTAPGAVSDGSMKFYVHQDASGSTDVYFDFDLTYSIGSDTKQTFSRHDVRFANMSLAQGSSLWVMALGPDNEKPNIAVSYGLQAPTVGLVNGLAMMSCS